MDATAFKNICEIVYDHSGIRISDQKKSMVAGRVAKRLKSLKLEDEIAYVEYLKKDIEREISDLMNAISTNVTHFFRGEDHFEFMGKVLRGWFSEGQKRLRIWSCASSTGEEPYSISMTLQEALEASPGKIDAKILATDISTDALAHAQRGVYPESLIQSIPPALQKKYLNEEYSEDSVNYRICDSIQEHIAFRVLNLSQVPFPLKGPLDLVFCRNVMFYFDEPIKRRLLEEIHRLLRPDGFLFIGHSENLSSFTDLFTRTAVSVYKKTV